MMRGPQGAAGRYRERVYTALQADEDADADALIADGESLLGRVDARQLAHVELDLALLYARRFESGDRTTDLWRAAELLRDGLGRVPHPSRERVAYLVNFAGAQQRAYEVSGSGAHLHEAERALREARTIEGDYSTRAPVVQGALGVVLFRRFEQEGDPTLLHEGVELLERAVASSASHGEAWARQLNLANALVVKATTGVQGAAARAISVLDELLRHAPEGHPIRVGALLVLGRAHRAAFEWSEDVRELDAGIACYRALLGSGDGGPVDAARAAGNLGNALRRRDEAAGDAAALDEAAARLRDAVAGLAHRAAEQRMHEANLGAVLVRRFGRTGDVDELREAVELFRTVAGAESADVLTRTSVAADLASAELALGRATDDASKLRSGLRRASTAIRAGHAAGLMDLDGGARLAQRLAEEGAFDLAGEVLELCMRAIETTGDVPAGPVARSRLFARIRDTIQLAGYVAGRRGRADEAVVVLERARARTLRDLLGLDVARLDRLAEAGSPELASAYAARARVLAAVAAGVATVADPQSVRHELDALTLEIRAIAGFEGFGRAPGIDDVYAAASDDPLVYACVTGFGSIAFVAWGGDRRIEMLDLPWLTGDDLGRRATAYRARLADVRAEPEGDAAFDAWGRELAGVTRWLGDVLMAPLAAHIAPRARRAALLLPGALAQLPVTGAWTRPDPAGDRRFVGDELDWSVAPSAVALLAARDVVTASTTRSAGMVADPRTPGLAPLPGAALEAAAVLRAFGQAQELSGLGRTDVVRALPNYDVTHFACHGVAEPDDPLRSRLLLSGDETLTLADVFATHLWRMRLCVLSACESSVAGATDPDQAVSLPAGLVQAGAAAVIASEWPVSDVVAATLMARFYALWNPRDEPRRSPLAAFGEARRWLRDASLPDVVALLRDTAVNTGELEAQLPAEGAPFAHPVEWAGFVYTGV